MLYLKKPKTDYKQSILNELKEVKTALKAANSRFNQLNDDELIEACVYEMQALEKQYDYIIKKSKAIV